MSTSNNDKFNFISFFPAWTVNISEVAYHAAAVRGDYVSSTLLREFRRSPAHCHDVTEGRSERRNTDAMRFGRAVHALLLEGERAFRARFQVGGPRNQRTGRSYKPGTRRFNDWVQDSGLDRQRVITDSEYADLCRMRRSLHAHRELSRLFGDGWPELSARADLEGVSCQARLDWLRPDNTVVDLKTIDDLGRFEGDARRFGYLHQFAFYADVCRAAGAGEVNCIAAVVEKNPPYRAGMWHFSAETLAPYAHQNRNDLRALAHCRETGVWPTGYERQREFPQAGIPHFWSN